MHFKNSITADNFIGAFRVEEYDTKLLLIFLPLNSQENL